MNNYYLHVDGVTLPSTPVILGHMVVWETPGLVTEAAVDAIYSKGDAW